MMDLKWMPKGKGLDYPNPDLFEPSRAHLGDVGFDLKCAENVTIMPHSFKFISFGIALEIPDGYFGLLAGRSGLGKKGIGLTHGVGIVDSGFRGELGATFMNNTGHNVCFYKGDRIAQIIMVPYTTGEVVKVDSMMMSDRGENGYGSTGI